MKNVMCFLFGPLLAISSLSGQSLKLKAIEIKGNFFYQDGERLKPNRELASVLALARCNDVDESLRKAKSLQTVSTIMMGAGIGLMGLSLITQSENGGSSGLLLGGAAIELIGVGFMFPAAKHRKKAVKSYNVIAGGGLCGD